MDPDWDKHPEGDTSWWCCPSGDRNTKPRTSIQLANMLQYLEAFAKQIGIFRLTPTASFYLDILWEATQRGTWRLSHPDLWAGLVGIVPTSARYVNHYWKNAHRLPMYLVGGELDSDRLVRNAMDLDRYFQKGFDATYVEYLGRGHEHFSDDIHRIFDWMGRKTRSFFPNSVEAVSMRPWDSFFWWIEMSRAPVRTIVLPAQWPPSSGVRALEISAKTTPGTRYRFDAERKK